MLCKDKSIKFDNMEPVTSKQEQTLIDVHFFDFLIKETFLTAMPRSTCST